MTIDNSRFAAERAEQIQAFRDNFAAKFANVTTEAQLSTIYRQQAKAWRKDEPALKELNMARDAARKRIAEPAPAIEQANEACK